MEERLLALINAFPKLSIYYFEDGKGVSGLKENQEIKDVKVQPVYTYEGKNFANRLLIPEDAGGVKQTMAIAVYIG